MAEMKLPTTYLQATAKKKAPGLILSICFWYGFHVIFRAWFTWKHVGSGMLEWAAPCHCILCCSGSIPYRVAVGISTSSSKLRCPFESVCPSAFHFSVILSLDMVWMKRFTFSLTFSLCFFAHHGPDTSWRNAFFPNATFDVSEPKRCFSCPKLPDESTACPEAGAPSLPVCLMAFDSLVRRSSTF